MEGILYKWTNYLSMWKQRYFVLVGCVLIYYMKKGEKPRGRIHLAIASINAGEDELKFEIDTGLTIMYLKAENIEDKIKWVKELKRAKIDADISFHAGNKNSLNFNKFGNNMQIHDPIYESERKVDSDSESENSIYKKLTYIMDIHNNIETNNNQIKYLSEDSHLSKEEYINNIILLSDSNEKNLEKLEKSVQLLKSNVEYFQKQYLGIAQFFTGANSNNTIDMEENKHIPGTSPSKNITKIIINNEGKEIHRSKAILKSEVNNFNQIIDDNNFIKKDKEVFYEAKENEDSENNIENIFTSEDKQVSSRNKKYKNKSIELPNINAIKTSSRPNQVISLSLPKSIPQINSKFFDPAYCKKRTNLPSERKKSNFSIWGILKDAIGKDLNKFSVPVYFNEPLSMLQKLCENFQYADLLSKAACDSNSYMRLAYVGAFCIGGYALNPKRTLKFFNPLLGETYEYVDNDLKFRYFSEQVCHHPAISACYVEGDGYIFYSNTNIKSNFKIMKATIEFLPISRAYINFTNFNEQISFSKPIAAGKNIIGNAYIDCYGKFSVNNHTTGDYAEFEIMEASQNEQGKVIGHVKNINGDVKLIIEGNWLTHLDVLDIARDETTTIWKKTIIDGDEEARFFFTDFSVNLNNLNEDLENVLPPTDSRFRPDQRALENQDLDLASKEKNILEEKQRARRKQMDKEKKNWMPKYFNETYDDLSGELVYQYSKDYWKDRKEKNYKNFPIIFN